MESVGVCGQGGLKHHAHDVAHDVALKKMTLACKCKSGGDGTYHTIF